MIYEETEAEKVGQKELTKEQRINLIRYGPDAIQNKTKKIAINLLAKYKPMINLNEYRMLANTLNNEARVAEKLINFEKDNEVDENLTPDEQAQIRSEYVKKQMKNTIGKKTRKPIVLNKNGDRESIFVNSRNVASSGYAARPVTTKNSSSFWPKHFENFDSTNIFTNLKNQRKAP